MPIICLEGPSGVGKSTTAQELMERVGAVAIPEVNELFQRPDAMLENWYLEKAGRALAGSRGEVRAAWMGCARWRSVSATLV